MPDHQFSQRQIIIASLMAGAGGLLPSLSNIAGKMVVQPVPDMPHIYVTIPLAIFFFIGIILNIAFNRQDWEIGKALIIGISAPGIITNLVSGARSVDTTPAISVPATVPKAWLDLDYLPILLGIRNASAQTRDIPNNDSTAKDSAASSEASRLVDTIAEGLPLKFSVDTDSDNRNTNINFPISIKIRAADGPQVGKILFGVDNVPASGLIFVPRGTSKLSIEILSKSESTYSAGILGVLPEKYLNASALIAPSILAVKIRVSPTSSGDFWWAAGASRIFAVTAASASIDGVPFIDTKLTLRCPAVPNSPPVFKTDRVLSQSSGWMSGGHDQREFCNKLTQSSASGSKGTVVTILNSSELSKKSWMGHVEYNYSCTVRIQSDPIIENLRIPECSDASDNP